MKTFHVNPANGNVGVCSAKSGNCPFGNEDEHYTSKEAARYNYELSQAPLEDLDNFKSGETKVDVQHLLLTSLHSVVLGDPYTKEEDELPIGSLLMSMRDGAKTPRYLAKLENEKWYSIWQRPDGTVAVSAQPRNLTTVAGSEKANDDKLFFSKLDPQLRGKIFNASTKATYAERLIASKLHDEWRESRKREGWRWQPLIKTDEDGKKVDIANTKFDSLPPVWKTENLASASVVLDALVRAKAYGGSEELNVPDLIHQAWLKRAKNPKGTQKAPYAGLSDYEKAKDVRVIRAALAVIQANY